MASDACTVSSLTLEPENLTELLLESDLQVSHEPRRTNHGSVMLLDWTLTGLDIFGWILDGLDRRRSAIGWIGLILVNPIGSNYLKGLAGT
jgi:hypothetical protein